MLDEGNDPNREFASSPIGVTEPVTVTVIAVGPSDREETAVKKRGGVAWTTL